MNRKSIIVIGVIIIIVCSIVLFNLLFSGNDESNNNDNYSQTENSFLLKLGDVDITPGKEFDKDRISEDGVVSEIQSCAFDGIDKVYTYENVEITVSSINGKDKIYSVYFLNDGIKTFEGVKISDGKNKMLEVYGENYENSINNKFIYTKNNVNISFLIENDIIVGIEYTLDL